MIFYDVRKDPEMVQYESIDEAIEMHIDNLTNKEISEMPNILNVYEFREVPIKTPSTKWLLDKILEAMDEDYLPDYMEESEATDVMENAAEMFLYIIEKEYNCRRYESNKKLNINILYWLKQNKPKLMIEVYKSFPNGKLFYDKTSYSS